jgi:acetyl-CoA carboxylase biotin carboxyl carrier protein
MNINEVKDLMREFDGSSLREFSWNNGADQLAFSKNNGAVSPAVAPVASFSAPVSAAPVSVSTDEAVSSAVSENSAPAAVAEGEAVTSPLVGVAYLAPAPDKAAFVAVGDTVKKGQTLLIIEAMKVMNEIPAPMDGVVTEVLVAAEDVVEFGQVLVRIK